MTRPILSGVCGSDTKLVLGEFEDGDIDNPMAAFSSLPHVPGHEVVAEVVALGPEARDIEVGQRVVLNPWLSCAPRGISPLCPPCQAGDVNLCWSFTKGDIGPGVHIGVVTGAPGAWAEQLAAHASMLVPGARRRDRRGGRAGRPVLGVVPRHRPPSATAGRESPWSSDPAPSGWPAWPSSPPCTRRSRWRWWPGSRPRWNWPGSSAPPPSSPTSPVWPWSRPWPSGRAVCSIRPSTACP